MLEIYFVKFNIEGGDRILDLALKSKDKSQKTFIFEYYYYRGK